jgi:DNA-binding PadR family transcriptional regulator
MAMPAAQSNILVTLAGGDAHGYAIMKSVQAAGEPLGPAALYQAVARLLELHLIEELEPSPSSGARSRRRCYRITTTGRAALVVELDRMHAVLERAAAAGIDRRAWRPSGRAQP